MQRADPAIDPFEPVREDPRRPSESIDLADGKDLSQIDDLALKVPLRAESSPRALWPLDAGGGPLAGMSTEVTVFFAGPLQVAAAAFGLEARAEP
mmetsp:Transcript_23285/g.54179  ORF Transcript_23285/g.54179 Transcript_23285/m.54179 type:complete len:95 (+) Transcript_23285:1148-1432(+)